MYKHKMVANGSKHLFKATKSVARQSPTFSFKVAVVDCWATLNKSLLSCVLIITSGSLLEIKNSLINTKVDLISVKKNRVQSSWGFGWTQQTMTDDEWSDKAESVVNTTNYTHL